MKVRCWKYLGGLLIVVALLLYMIRGIFPASNKGMDRSELSAVAAFSTHEVWAVGTVLPAGARAYEPLIEYWNGTRWSVMSSPQAPGATLSGVTAISAHDVWAVGSLIEHWDGRQWHIIQRPTMSASLLAVAAVSAENIWAVGYQTNKQGTTRTLIEQWNGATWKIVSSPNGGKDNNRLTAIAVVSASDIWAVGSSTAPSSGREQTLIEHWDGSLWSITPSFNADLSANTSNSLGALTVVSKDNLWAVGGSSVPLTSVYQLLIMHWNGTTWQRVTGPKVGSACCLGLLAVTAITATDTWAVGAGASNQPLVVHWNGATWNNIAAPSPNIGTGGLHGVAALSARDIWAVGTMDITNDASQQFIEHWNGTAWHLVENPKSV